MSPPSLDSQGVKMDFAVCGTTHHHFRLSGRRENGKEEEKHYLSCRFEREGRV